MSLHIKLFTNFWSHRKTAKLRSLIGNDALWVPIRIWSYAAENQPDGDFSSYSPEELALLIGYSGNAQAMLEALQQACFMDKMKIHDWVTHNGYHHEFSERAKKAAEARWSKKKRREEKIGEDKIREEKRRDKQCSKHASSIIEPKNVRKTLCYTDFIEELRKLYPSINIENELQKMRAWILTKPGRQLTYKFCVNWLNRCDSPLTQISQPTKKTKEEEIADLKAQGWMVRE